MDEPQPNKKDNLRSLGPAAALVGTLVAFLLGQVLGSVAAWFTAAGLDTFTPFFILDSWFGSTEAQFLLVIFSGIFTLLILWFFMRRLRIGWRALGLSRKPLWRDLGRALLGLPAYFAIFIVLGSLAGVFLGVNLEQEQEIGFDRVVGSSDMLLAFVSLVVVPPIVEEVLFRGFLFTGLRSKLGFVATALIVSALFALPHMFASSNGLLWIAAIDTFVLSLVLCYLREKTGALWAAIVLHAIKNSLAYLFLFLA